MSINLDLLSQKAIKAALRGDWEQAIALNKEILSLDENNINALNRLAKAYIESKQRNEAKRILNRVLRLEPTNEIAKKNLRRVDKISHTEGIASPEFFIKEPSKTKTIIVESQISPTELLHLGPGEKLTLKPYKNKVKVFDLGGHEIAQIGNNLASLLIKLIKRKVPLSVNLVSLEGKKLSILIKGERGTFPPEKKQPDYHSYATQIRETSSVESLVEDEL